jgi:hypothetical protein
VKLFLVSIKVIGGARKRSMHCQPCSVAAVGACSRCLDGAAGQVLTARLLVRVSVAVVSSPRTWHHARSIYLRGGESSYGCNRRAPSLAPSAAREASEACFVAVQRAGWIQG